VRAASPALTSLLNELRAQPDAQILMADCYTFTLRTGLILTYTSADVPIALNGYTYLANSILVDGLQFKCTAGLDVDQQQITICAKPTDTIGGVPFLEALRNGVFDGCEIQREKAFLTSWNAAPAGSVILFKGRMGAIGNVGRTTAEITVNSDLVLLQINMPRNLYSPQCVHVLYDSGCGLVKSAFGAAGTVGSGSTSTVINWSSASSVYTQGTVLFHPASMPAFQPISKAPDLERFCSAQRCRMYHPQGMPSPPIRAARILCRAANHNSTIKSIFAASPSFRRRQLRYPRNWTIK